MMGGFATQRRAERFDALLSGDPTETESRDADLVALVSAMRDLPPVEARPEFVASLRERLVAQAATMPAPERSAVEHLSLQRSTVRRERRIATALGGLAIASATTSMAVASQDALPGETLYPIKRALESVQSSLQSDDSDRAATLLDHAAQRLVEARELSAGGADGEVVAESLDRFSSQANEGADLTIGDYRETRDEDGVVRLHAFAATALEDLEALSDTVPESARASLVGAVNTVRSIDSAATRACPDCEGAAALDDALLLVNLEDLLSAEPEALQSLALAAEDIAAQLPPTTPTDLPSSDPGVADQPTSAPSPGEDETTSDPLDPITTLVPGQLPTSTPENQDGPVRTLLDEARSDLEDLAKQSKGEDWTLLDDGTVDGLSQDLGISGSTD